MKLNFDVKLDVVFLSLDKDLLRINESIEEEYDIFFLEDDIFFFVF